MAIDWQDSYRLGDAEIDAQHHRLFVLVNALFSLTDKDKLTEALANLLRHTRDHFSHEENNMRRLGYPGMKAHVEQHNTLLSKLGNVSAIIGDYSMDLANLESFLAAWLLNHMETLDAQFVSFMRSR